MTLITCPECGTEVSDLAMACPRCGYPIRAPEQPKEIPPTPHSVAPSKFIVLSLVTLGLYPLYWAYRNWWWVKKTRDKEVIPVLRAIFSPIFMFSLLRHLEAEAADEEIDIIWSPLLIALLFFALTMSWRLPDPYWLVSLLTFASLLAPQATANAIHTKVSGQPPNANYSAFAIGVVIVGGIMLVLVLVGTFLPEVTEDVSPAITTL